VSGVQSKEEMPTLLKNERQKHVVDTSHPENDPGRVNSAIERRRKEDLERMKRLNNNKITPDKIEKGEAFSKINNAISIGIQ